MGHLKKALALILALAMALSCGIAAMAESGGGATEATPEEKLIAALEKGGTVTLTEDVELTKTLLITKPVTIDGKGFAIDASGIPAGSSMEGHGILVHLVTGKVTLKNLSVRHAKKYGIQAYRSDDVVLDNVTVSEAEYGGVYVNASKVTATGLALMGNVWGGIEVGIGADIDDGAAELTLDSYSFGVVDTNPVIWIDGPSIDEIKITAPDSLVKSSGNGANADQDWYTVKTMEETALREAIEQAQTGATVKLTGNVYLSETLILTKAITLDGNGYTILPGLVPEIGNSESGHGILVKNVTGKVVIKDVTIFYVPKYGIQAYCSDDVVLEDVTVMWSEYGGLLVNASKVTASKLALLDNQWGGVEVGIGAGIEDGKAEFKLNSFKFRTATDNDTPVIWIDGPESSNIKITTTKGLKKEIKNISGKEQVWYVVNPDASNGGGSSGGSSGGTVSSPTQNNANTAETTSKIEDTAAALKDSSQELPKGVVTTGVGATSVHVIPVSLSSGGAALSVGTVNTVGAVPANVGLQVSIDNAAVVTLTGGFGNVTEPGRYYYPMDYAAKAPDADQMLKAVKSAGAQSDAFKLGGNFTLPKAAGVSVKTPIADGKTVNIYVYNDTTGSYTLVASSVVKDGSIAFITATFGQFLVTTGRI